MQYKIYEGGASGHCCFNYTIVDTENCNTNVCEVFELNDAIKICRGMNLVDSGTDDWEFTNRDSN